LRIARRRRTLAAGVTLGSSGKSGSEDGSGVELGVVVGSDVELVVVVGYDVEPVVVDVVVVVVAVVVVAVVVVVVDDGHATHELGPEIGAGTTISMRLKSSLKQWNLLNTSQTSGQVNDGVESYSMKIDPSPDSQKLTLLQLRAPYSPPLTTQEPVAGLSTDFSKVL
jgi:hypothetical protein